MIEPMTLSGVLMNVLGALPQKGGANDQLRNDLWGEIVRGPQDEASMSARVGSLIDGAKISPARAHELFKSEVQLDLGRKGTPHQQQIMRHTLNNMRSFGANSRQQVQAAILAADKGWDLSADELTGKLPPDPSSAPPRLRPFVNLLVRAEQENDPEAFVKAAGLAYGVLSGSGMAQLRQDLIRDGHARSAALVGLIFSTPRPPGESAAEVLDLKRNMAAAYAVALANDGIEEFLQDLEDGAHQNDQQAAGMRLEDKVAMLTLKAKIAMASGEIGSTPDRPATPESIAFLEAYERAIDPIRRRAKRNSTLATFNEQYSKWLRSLASAVRSTPVPPRVIPPGQRTVTLQDGTVVSVGDEPYRGDPNPGAADVNPYAPDYVPPPDDAAQASTPEPGDIPDNIRAGLTDYYKTLLDPDTLTRYRDQFLIQRHRIAGASSAGDQKAAIQSLNIAREYLERADAMLKVLSGRSAKGPFEKYIRQAMVDNLKAITDAAAAGKTVVSLKNPMNGDEEIWPVTPGDQDEVAQSPPTPWPPPRPPTLTEMSMAALTKSSSEVASLNQDIDEIAKALGIQSKNANFTVLKAKALDSGTRSFKLAKREAAIANNFTGFRSAIELTFKFEQTHYVLSHAGKEMSVPTTLQRANVQRILTATKSKATLADVTGPYETMTKQQLQQLLSSMPSEGKMMDLTKNDSPIKVQFSVEPGGAGMNVSEFYGAMNLINAVRYSAQKSTEGEGSTGPTGPNKPGAKPASGTQPPPLSGVSPTPENSVISTIPVSGATPDAMAAGVRQFLLDNKGKAIKAHAVRDDSGHMFVDGDSGALGACGIDASGQEYCVQLHVRLVQVNSVEYNEANYAKATLKTAKLLGDATNLSIRINPLDPISSKYDRWSGIIYAKYGDGSIKNLNVELSSPGVVNDPQSGFNSKYAAMFPLPPELPQNVIDASLQGGSHGDVLQHAPRHSGRPPAGVVVVKEPAGTTSGVSPKSTGKTLPKPAVLPQGSGRGD